MRRRRALCFEDVWLTTTTGWTGALKYYFFFLVGLHLRAVVLTIAGERSSETASQSAGHRRIERSSGSFRRAIRVPDGVDAAAITATHEHGVLTVSVPKPAAPRGHRIAVSAPAAVTAADAVGEPGEQTAVA